MQTPTLSRTDILTALRAGLEPLDFVHGMWEAGAAAFDRVDDWSDIDLGIIVDDDRVRDGFAAVEHALESVSPIELVWEVPQPAWHGHEQKFYRLAGASPYLVVDLSVMKRSSRDKFLQREMHGDPVVHIDRNGVVTPDPLDVDGLERRLRARLAMLRTTFDLFQVLVTKELNRGNSIEALVFYQGSVVRPVVELLRIRHSPARHGFQTRYVHYDLPSDAVNRLERLFFVPDAGQLATRQAEAQEWFHELLQELEAKPRLL